MRSRHTLAPPPRAGRTRRALAPLRQAARVMLSAALVAPGLLFGGAPRAAAQTRTTTLPDPVPAQQVSSSPKQMPVEQLPPGQAVVVNFKQMSELMARGAAARNIGPRKRAIHSPGRGPVWPSPPPNGLKTMAANSFTANAVAQANAPSPSPSQSFLAQEDSPRIGTTDFIIPPDTMGAVGLDKVFTQTNGNFRIHDKVTGAPLSTVNAETFWSATGATGVFDPRVVYDPYQNRWITCIVSNQNSAASSVLVGVSQTSDPQGSYFLYRVVVGAPVGDPTFPDGAWADFPMLGFNKNWIVVGYNLHASTNNAFIGGEILVFDYPAARAGVASVALVPLAGNFCIHPATTLSPTEETLYLLQQANPATAEIVAYTVTGTPSSFAVSQFGFFVRPGGGWVEPFGDLLPQNCVPGSPVPTFQCPPGPRRLEVSDSNIRGNVVFRNGKLWYSQTVGIDLPGGDAVDHTAAQWTAVTPTLSAGPSLTMTFNDGGRVEDTTATATNGGKWYSYTSVAVNRKDDVLLGFSEFESDDFVDAAYTFRAAGDPAGTMRDTVVFKEGEDYYDKDFGTGRNRFGDYSHAVVDPVNDVDLWTIQEYTQPRVVSVPPTVNNPANGLGPNSSRWSTWWAKLGLAVPGGEGDLVISEFRVRGPGGADDEYVEIHNRTENEITVTPTDGSTGYALASSDNTVRFVIPRGTTIPARGHYLATNSLGYSLSNYPAGPVTTATPDITYNVGIPDSGRGIALFNTANPVNFNTATRLDAVGPVSETNTLYKEQGGLPDITANNLEQAWVRDNCGKGGNLATFGPCPSDGAVVDNDNNSADFYYVEVSGIDVGAGARIGAPGPENRSSPVRRDDVFAGFLLDQTKTSTQVPNRVRTQCPTAPECANPAVAQFGTMELRRRIVNNTGAVVNRLRFRIVDTVTAPAAPNRADIRALSSTDQSGVSVNDPATCSALQVPPSSSPTPTCTVTIRGLTLEQSSPTQQPFGGGFNSSLSADSVTIAPLAPGQSINIRILLGVKVSGNFRFLLSIEALP